MEMVYYERQSEFGMNKKFSLYFAPLLEPV